MKNERIVKSVAKNAAFMSVGLLINHAVDNKLAKSEIPGRINRLMRWNLRVGRKPVLVALSLVGNILLDLAQE